MKILNRLRRSVINRVNARRVIRASRVRYKIRQVSDYRLSVYRSNKNIHAQIIDNSSGKTLVYACSTANSFKKEYQGKSGIEKAVAVGKDLAVKAIAIGIKSAAFDKGAYKFWGRVKALAESADANGLQCTSKIKEII